MADTAIRKLARRAMARAGRVDFVAPPSSRGAVDAGKVRRCSSSRRGQAVPGAAPSIDFHSPARQPT